MTENQKKNYDFLKTEPSFRILCLELGFDLSFYDLLLRQLVEKNKLFEENILTEYVDSGSFGIVFKTEAGRIVKFFGKSFVHPSPLNPSPDLFDASENEHQFYSDASNRMFSGKSRISELPIFDTGRLDHGSFVGNNIYFRITAELILLYHYFLKFDDENVKFEVNNAVNAIPQYSTIRGIKEFSQRNGLDFSDEFEFWKRNLRRRVLFDFSDAENILELSFAEFARTYCRSLFHFIKVIPEFSPAKFATMLHKECDKIMKFELQKELGEFDSFVLSDVRIGNIGLLPQNQSIPVLFDF